MKTTKYALAQALAWASLSSLALGAAFTLAHGPAAYLAGAAAFAALGLLACKLNPNL
jgi:uncharacterized membrane protein AbrB (regulator of aidB expression)